jgi:hypothetical protein
MEGGCQPIDGTCAGWASSNVEVVSRSLTIRNIPPAKVAWVAFGVAVAAFAFWMVISVVGPGDHSEYWTAWNSSIEIAWKIIPASLVINIVCAIVAVAAPARTGEKSRVAGLVVLILVVAFAIYVVPVVMNLRIS